jgi:adenylate cyclase
LAGRPEAAKHHAAEVLRLYPGYSISRDAGREPLKRASDREHLIDGLRKAGLPD